MTKKWKKKNSSLKRNVSFFEQKLQFTYLSLGPLKRHPSYRRSFQPSKENIKPREMKFICFFSIFVGHFCPPESGSNPDPDPQHRNKSAFFLSRLNFMGHKVSLSPSEPVFRIQILIPDPDPNMRSNGTIIRKSLLQNIEVTLWDKANLFFWTIKFLKKPAFLLLNI